MSPPPTRFCILEIHRTLGCKFDIVCVICDFYQMKCAVYEEFELVGYRLFSLR